MNKKSVAVFDLDGTLLDTLDDITDSLNVIRKNYGIAPITRPEVNGMVGNGLKVLFIKSLKDGENTSNFDKMFNEFVAYYKEHSMIKTGIYAGMPEVLSELKKRGVKTAIVTNKNIEAARAMKDELFSDTIDCIYGEDEAHGVNKKPAPDTVFKALEELKASKEDAVYIGDSEVDIKTAANAGLPCLAVAWGFRTKEEQIQAGGEYFIDKPSDLLDYFI